MPKITTFIGKIIGSRLPIESSRWSTVYVYEPTIDRVRQARGNLYLVLDMASPDEALGTELINIIRESYYHELDSDPLQSLESALSQANKKIEEYSSKTVTLKQEALQQLNIACIVLCDQDLHLAQIGEVHTYLIRKGRLNKISNVSPQTSATTQSFQNVASGRVEMGDIVTLSTPSLFELLPLSQFKKITTSCYPSVAASRISEVITEKSAEGIAPSVLVLEINADVKDELPVEEQTIAKEKNLENQMKFEKDEIVEKITQKGTKSYEEPFPEQPLDLAPRNQQMPPRHPRQSSETPYGRERKSDTKSNDFLKPIINGIKLIGDVISGKEDISKLSKLFLVLGIVLVAVVGFKILSSPSKSNPVVEQNQAFEEAWDNYTKAREVLRTNDFVNAREYLLAAKAKADEARSLNIFPEETAQLQSDIQKELDKLDGVTRLTDLAALADISSLTADADPGSIAATSDSLYVLDQVAQKLYRITKDTNQLLLAKDQLFSDSTAKYITTTADKVYIYAEQNDVAKVGEFDPADDSLTEVQVVFDNTWKKATVVQAWEDAAGNARLYFVDPSENAIWRFRRAGNQFGVPENYLDGLEDPPDLSQVVDMSIDGNIYLLNSDGTILKFVLSDLEPDYSLKGLKVAISDPIALVSATPQQNISEEIGKKLYIADSGNSRVLIFGKEDGQLAKIYAASSAFDDLRDLFVDEVSNYLYVVDGTKIYRIQM